MGCDGTLSATVKRGPFCISSETGCGGSRTIILSQLSRQHITFVIEGDNRTVSELRSHRSLKAETVTFVEGETRETVPGYLIPGGLDMLILNRPQG